MRAFGLGGRGPLTPLWSATERTIPLIKVAIYLTDRTVQGFVNSLHNSRRCEVFAGMEARPLRRLLSASRTFLIPKSELPCSYGRRRIEC